jgi:hypothetical protein
MCFFKTQGEKKCKKKTLALKMLWVEASARSSGFLFKVKVSVGV